MRQVAGRAGLGVEPARKSNEYSRSTSWRRLNEEDSTYKFNSLSHEYQPEMVMLYN